MRPDPPLLSPLIWTSIATGRRPEDHGVLDFMVDIPGGGQAPVSGGARQTKALWEIFSDAGRSVFVAGWWATWPADQVRGAMVSDRLAPPHVRLARDSAGLVYPTDLLQRVQTLRVGPEQIDYPTLNRFVPTTRTDVPEPHCTCARSAGSHAHLPRDCGETDSRRAAVAHRRVLRAGRYHQPSVRERCGAARRGRRVGVPRSRRSDSRHCAGSRSRHAAARRLRSRLLSADRRHRRRSVGSHRRRRRLASAVRNSRGDHGRSARRHPRATARSQTRRRVAARHRSDDPCASRPAGRRRHARSRRTARTGCRRKRRVPMPPRHERSSNGFDRLAT